MTKSKNTKRALLASVLSMILCLAMLVGSTFAWFTDSVTSGKNKIVAGNLDVELNWSTDGSTWERVNEDTDMFKDTLWEPGYTRVVYLQVENVGSLALKYKFGINVADKVIGKTADDKDIDLSEFIKFGVVDNAAAYTADDAGRTEAREAVKDSAVLVSAGYDSEEKNLSAKTKSDTIALVVYMPEEVGNDANYGTGKTQPSIDLGITLVATQYTEESDSFGDQYDNDAKCPILITKGITKDENGLLTEEIVLGAKSADLVSENAPVHVKVPANVVIESDAEDFTLRIEPTTKYPTVSVDDASKVSAYKIEMPLEDTNTVPVSVTMFVGQNKKLLAVYHDAVLMTEADTQAADTYQYDPASGVITMYLTHCSTFTFEYQLVKMFDASTKDELAAAINADTDHMIEVNWKGKSFNLGMFDRGFNVTKNITLNAGTNAVTTGESGSYPRFVVKDGGFLTVNAEEFVNANGYNVWPSIATWIKVDGASSTAVLNGGTYSTSFSHAAITAENSGNVLITDGRYSGSGSGGSGTLDYSNGTVTAKSGSTVTVTGGTFSCSGYKTSIFCADDALVIVEDATISSCNGKQFAVFNGGVIKVSKTAFSSKPTSTNGTVAEEENYWVITAAN